MTQILISLQICGNVRNNCSSGVPNVFPAGVKGWRASRQEGGQAGRFWGLLLGAVGDEEKMKI